MSWDNETTVETVVLLSHTKPDSHINVKVEFGEDDFVKNIEALETKLRDNAMSTE